MLKEDSNFLKANTLDTVKVNLSNMEGNLRSKCDRKIVKAIKKSGQEFFMDVVTILCFGRSSSPNSDLMNALMKTVFVDGDIVSIRDGTPAKRKIMDKIPTVRSFLLQLLLDYRYMKN